MPDTQVDDKTQILRRALRHLSKDVWSEGDHSRFPWVDDEIKQIEQEFPDLSYDELVQRLRYLYKRLAYAKGLRSRPPRWSATRAVSGDRQDSLQKGGDNMPVELEVPDETPIKPGSYRAKIVEVSESQSRYDPEKTVISIDYELLDGAFAGRTVRKFYSPTLTSRSKLGTLVRRLAKESLTAGQTFDVESLVGREVDVLLTQEETDDGTTYALVADVFAPEAASEAVEEPPF